MLNTITLLILIYIKYDIAKDKWQLQVRIRWGDRLSTPKTNKKEWQSITDRMLLNQIILHYIYFL